MKYICTNKLHYFAIIAFLLLTTYESNGSSLPWLENMCIDDTMFFDPSTFQCSACLQNAKTVEGVCQCDKGFAYVINSTTGIPACESCSSRNQAVSTSRSVNGSQICIPCGGDPQLSCLVDSHYDATLFQCVCPQGSMLVENIGSVVLSAQMCVRCPNGDCSSWRDPYKETSPGAFVCQSGYSLLYDGSCVPQSVYDSFADAARGSSTTLIPPNVGNSGKNGVTLTLDNLRENAIGSAILCRKGNSTACNYLANLCVLMMYNAEATPCALYRHLQTNGSCGAQWCDPSLSLPPLYYNSSNSNVRAPVGKSYEFTQEKGPIFILSTYDLNGTWRGFHKLYEKTNLCQLPTPLLNDFFKSSEMRSVSCYRNWGWFFSMNHSEFHEVYMVDPRDQSNWIPVPLLIDYSNHLFDPQSKQNDWLYRSLAASDEASSLDHFRRRFHVYVDDAHVGGYNNSELSYITTIWSMSLLLFPHSRRDREFKTPVLIFQYASKNISELPEPLGDPLHSSYLNKDYTPCCTLDIVQQIVFPPLAHLTNTGVNIVVIVLSIICLLTSSIRTYGWMRRRQNHFFDASALFRFFIYLFDHISNVYFLIVCIFSWYFYLIQKASPRYGNVAGDSEVHITSMLYVVLGAKSITVLYYLAEQCNAYYFLIDWERPKGESLPDDKEVPLSMWRATFVANKLNKLQTLRYWDPLQVMAVILLFLGGLVYRTAPSDDLLNNKIQYFAEVTDKTLRVAVDTFFWVVVTLFFYLVRFQVYYRCIAVDPLQEFVDLCSVSNISVIILIEEMYGFYIHGESIYDYTDVSMKKFQHNLFIEAQGNMPARGLGGQRECQTFEVNISSYLRRYLYVCYSQLFLEHQRSHKNLLHVVHPASWHFFDFIAGSSQVSHVSPQVVWSIKDSINHAFQMVVSRVERTILHKSFLHKFFDFPPNIMLMNRSQSDGKDTQDLFFFDDIVSYGRALMLGLDFNLFILYSAFFAIIESSLRNIYISMLLTFIIEVAIHWYRKHEGMSNFCAKMIVDERLFI